MVILRNLALAMAVACPGPVALAEDRLVFEVVAKDGRLAPARLEVPAGKRVKLVLKNEGPGPCEFENPDLRVEKVLGPGASSFVVIHPLKPGSYKFFDEFHPNTSEMILIAK